MTITAAEIELALMTYFDTSRNFIIPNISNGFRGMNYEIDLMIVTRARYAYEVEIKISASDLKRDQKKWKWNYCIDQHYFKKSYFAIPADLTEYQEFIPAHAGIIAVEYRGSPRFWWNCTVVREPTPDKLAKKVSDSEYAHLGELAMLRMWDLKCNVRDLAHKNRDLENSLVTNVTCKLTSGGVH